MEEDAIITLPTFFKNKKLSRAYPDFSDTDLTIIVNSTCTFRFYSNFFSIFSEYYRSLKYSEEHLDLQIFKFNPKSFDAFMKLMSGFEEVKISNLLLPSLLDVLIKLKIDNGNDYFLELDKQLSNEIRLTNFNIISLLFLYTLSEREFPQLFRRIQDDFKNPKLWEKCKFGEVDSDLEIDERHFEKTLEFLSFCKRKSIELETIDFIRKCSPNFKSNNDPLFWISLFLVYKNIQLERELRECNNMEAYQGGNLETIEKKKTDLLQKISFYKRKIRVKLLEFQHNEEIACWKNGTTSQISVQAPFHIVFRILLFPKGENTWGGLVGLSTKIVDFENIKIHFYKTDFMWLVNVLEGGKVHSNVDEDALRLKEPYDEMEMKMDKAGTLMAKTNLMKEFVVVYEDLNTNIPYFPCVAFANKGHIEVWSY